MTAAAPLASLDCVVVSVVSRHPVQVCNAAEERNVCEPPAPHHKPPPLSHKILVVGRSNCRVFFFPLHHHGNSQRNNEIELQFLLCPDCCDSTEMSYANRQILRVLAGSGAHVDLHLLELGALILVCGERGHCFQTKLLSGLLSDLDDI